ncbi:hypothetical protein [Tepidibacter hydrothermalis]|uniref:Uncharacterized protein n=1 Tax=Tepidibacter hydrothermalis TaxID=3036126 RepID=A0ABY8EGA5_9FIRM|nr:hypothetical protein [Tepidibacter hydrothermalis]WFD10784.1 hypothetical protein P4S50_01525 [Tepidibacter hydrothermalis]
MQKISIDFIAITLSGLLVVFLANIVNNIKNNREKICLKNLENELNKQENLLNKQQIILDEQEDILKEQ